MAKRHEKIRRHFAERKMNLSIMSTIFLALEAEIFTPSARARHDGMYTVMTQDLQAIIEVLDSMHAPRIGTLGFLSTAAQFFAAVEARPQITFPSNLQVKGLHEAAMREEMRRRIERHRVEPALESQQGEGSGTDARQLARNSREDNESDDSETTYVLNQLSSLRKRLKHIRRRPRVDEDVVKFTLKQMDDLQERFNYLNRRTQAEPIEGESANIEDLINHNGPDDHEDVGESEDLGGLDDRAINEPADNKPAQPRPSVRSSLEGGRVPGSGGQHRRAAQQISHSRTRLKLEPTEFGGQRQPGQGTGIPYSALRPGVMILNPIKSEPAEQDQSARSTLALLGAPPVSKERVPPVGASKQPEREAGKPRNGNEDAGK